MIAWWQRFPPRTGSPSLSGVYPDIRLEIHARAGRKLSDELQDGTSFRYGIVSLGGRDRADVLRRFKACRAGLGIVLLPVGGGRENIATAAMQAAPITGADLYLS